MDYNKSVDLDLYGRGFDGIFGEGSELDSKRQALLKLKAIEDFRVHVKPGMHIDYDLYGRGDPRVFETVEKTTGQPEPEPESGPESGPAANTGKTRGSRFSPRTFLVPVKLLKKKVGAFVRKLSGSSARNRSGDESPRSASRSASVQSVTPVAVPEETVSEIDGVAVADEAPGVHSLSPISDARHTVEEDPVQDEEAIRDATLLDENNVVTVVDSADVESMSDAEDAAYEDRIDNVPRRVRSKLPSEEQQPYIEPGMVSKVIAKLNSASSSEFKQAPSFVKKSSLLPLSPTAARAVTEISSSAERDESDSSRSVLKVLSLTQSSVASEAKKSSEQSSEQSELVDVSSSGRVERMCSLFQEEDSPSLFQYGTSGVYGTQSTCIEAGKNGKLQGNSQQPLIPSPRDLFTSSVHHEQKPTAQNAESPEAGSFDSKRLSGDDVADVTANYVPLFADESNSLGESASGSEATAPPLVPGGLSCDSQADLDHVLGENRDVHASGSIRASGSDVQPLAVEDGTVEEMNKQGPRDSGTSAGEGAEEGATNVDEDNAPVSDSGDSASGAVPLVLGEKKETESTFDGEGSEVEAVMSSQEGSAIPVDASSNRVVPMDFVPLSSKMFDEYYETDY